jgi:hypothetical protein
VVTAIDDAQLASMLERLDIENQDVSGDSDDSEEEDEENGEVQVIEEIK